MRALLAKDPKRFHISIVYLMTYLTRSNSEYKVQHDKLEMILRYIIEVIPLEYQVDAVKALKYLTDREKKSGKSTLNESIVDVKLFKKGNYQNCIKHGDDSYHYSHDIHGKRMAEELALYLSEYDRLYVMYLLYRLTILDGIITTDSSDSEMDMLEDLCVDGMKIDKSDLDELIHEFATRKDQFWYDKHFADKNGRYPSSNLLANVFRVDLDELASMKHKVTKTSFLDPIQNFLAVSLSVLFVLFVAYRCWVGDLMTYAYPFKISIIGFLVVLVLIVPLFFIKSLDSAVVDVLRTDIENRLQRRGLIISSILSTISIIMLMFGTSNLLLLIGNETYANPKNSFQVTVPVTGTHYSRSKSSCTYYVDFPEISFSDMKIPEVSDNKKTGISYMNSLCLNSLPRLSGLDLFGIRYYKKKTSRSVPKSVYDTAKGKYIKLNFVVGYFGLVYHDTYQIMDHNDDENVVVDSESDQ
ncbi:MAG: hypothetical protein Q4B61_10240 [Bacteroidales bacterium]|nr:hypothetical protein [Bacteroidales bacterium]